MGPPALGWALATLFASLLCVADSHCADMALPSSYESKRPGADSGPTPVSVGIWIADVSRIDSADQTFDANVAVVMSWRDPALAHTEPGVKHYTLRDIWHPDWLVADATAKLRYSFPEVADVDADGTVTYRQRLVGNFSQKLDLHAFPFDRATFRIHFVMFGQKPTDIAFLPNAALVAQGLATGAGTAPDLTLQDWRITDTSARVLPYDVAPGFQFAGYAVEFRAQRLAQYYVVKVIIPLFLIVIMSWAVFWVDPTLRGSQISIAVTSMLTLIAYRFSVGSETPKLPYLTSLDTFILVSSILVLLALIQVVATGRLVSSQRLDLARRIDRWSRYAFPIAFVVLAVATLLR